MMDDLLSAPSLEASLDDLKAVYRVLSTYLPQHPELEDNVFVESLRRLLEVQARAQGIDPVDETAWEAWLKGDDEGEEPPRGEMN
jgi:hypothetical protein